jgi:hypothetical protein
VGDELCKWQRLLGTLQDERWHTVKEVSRKARVAESHVQKVFDFLTEFNIADQRNMKIKLKPEMDTLQES